MNDSVQGVALASLLIIGVVGCQLTELGGCVQQTVRVENRVGASIELEVIGGEAPRFEASAERWQIAPGTVVMLGVGERCEEGAAWHPNTELPLMQARRLPAGSPSPLEISEWLNEDDVWTGRIRQVD